VAIAQSLLNGKRRDICVSLLKELLFNTILINRRKRYKKEKKIIVVSRKKQREGAKREGEKEGGDI